MLRKLNDKFQEKLLWPRIIEAGTGTRPAERHCSTHTSTIIRCDCTFNCTQQLTCPILPAGPWSVRAISMPLLFNEALLADTDSAIWWQQSQPVRITVSCVSVWEQPPNVCFHPAVCQYGSNLQMCVFILLCVSMGANSKCVFSSCCDVSTVYIL
jgi:hypothetical protein